MNPNFDNILSAEFDQWVASLTDEQRDLLLEVVDGIETEIALGEVYGESIEDAEEPGVRIVMDEPVSVIVDAPKEQKEVVVDSTPKAAKVKCKCCGFAKKSSRVNAEGICKVCYVALATASPDAPVVVVGRQGKRGRNTVSVVIGGERVKVQRKVRLES